MARQSTRREFLVGAAGGAALTAFTANVDKAWSQESMVGVEWGGDYLSAAKELEAKQDKVKITWVLHAGGAAAILPKIKASWPRVQYDLVAGWDPIFMSMITEGWAETVTVSDVPNLADVPEGLIKKDSQGNWKNIPRTISPIYWGYREDTAPIKLEHIEQLLDPRLKGQICFPDPIMGVNFQIVTLALARGGDEHHMEPGWDFMKELARSGNIGRVAHADADIVNSLTSRETSITFASPADFNEVKKNFPVKELTKVKGDKGLKSGIVTEGWTVLKGGKTRLAFEYANFAMNPENDALFNSRIGNIPTNTKSKVDEKLQYLVFSSDDLSEYAYLPDWSYMSSQLDGAQKRWEQEIVPLLKA